MPDDSPGTEDRIRSVATELFYSRGYHATTMREIAAGVHIKAGSLYNHYSGKQEILFRICLETARELDDGVRARLEGIEDVEAQLHELILWHVRFHAENRFAARVADGQLAALSKANRVKVIKIRDSYELLLRDLLQRGAKEVAWIVDDPRVTAIGIATMCTEVDAWYRDDGPLSPAEIGEIFASFILRGLGRDAARTPSGGALGRAGKSRRPARRAAAADRP
jgi:AcrR family transcriptional regulator